MIRLSARVATLTGLVAKDQLESAARTERLLSLCRPPDAAPTALAAVVPPATAPAAKEPERSPPQDVDVSRATDIIERAIPSGQWTRENVIAFRNVWTDMNDDQRKLALDALMKALNQRGLRPTQPGAPF